MTGTDGRGGGEGGKHRPRVLAGLGAAGDPGEKRKKKKKKKKKEKEHLQRRIQLCETVRYPVPGRPVKMWVSGWPSLAAHRPRRRSRGRKRERKREKEAQAEAHHPGGRRPRERLLLVSLLVEKGKGGGGEKKGAMPAAQGPPSCGDLRQQAPQVLRPLSGPATA